MIAEGAKIRAMSAPWGNGVELMVLQGESYGVNVVMERLPEASLVEPTMRIDNTAAQALMDDLWAAGVRPTEGTGSAGSLRATEKHLADMRAIAFKKLGIEGR